MDVEARLARLQRRMELAEVMRHQIRRNAPVEFPTASALAEFADTRVTPVPAVAAVYQILMAVQPILHRYPGLTLGIWPSPPDEGDERVLRTAAMIVVDPSQHTLSLELPLDEHASAPGLGWPHLAEVTHVARPADDAVDTGAPLPVGEGPDRAAAGSPATAAPDAAHAEMPVNGASRLDAPAESTAAAPAVDSDGEPPSAPPEAARVSAPGAGNGRPDSVAVELARLLRGSEEG